MIPKSLKAKLINFYPPFFFSGIKVIKRSKDYRYLKARLKLRFWNANLFGTQFGGALFTLTDPFYPMMILMNLGNEYFVTDKAASIKFLKPGKTDVTAEFILTEEDIQHIIDTLQVQEKMDWVRKVQIKDVESNVVAVVERIIYIRKKTNPIKSQ